jgi:hypothetical protein
MGWLTRKAIDRISTEIRTRFPGEQIKASATYRQGREVGVIVATDRAIYWTDSKAILERATLETLGAVTRPNADDLIIWRSNSCFPLKKDAGSSLTPVYNYLRVKLGDPDYLL